MEPNGQYQPIHPEKQNQAHDEVSQPPREHQYVPPLYQKSRRGKKKIWLTTVALLLVALIAGGVYWFVYRGDDKSGQSMAQGQEQSHEQAQGEQQPVSNTPDPTPVIYKSEALELEVTHRKDWTVTESGNEITLKSPQFSYQRVDGESSSGSFTLKIRRGVPEGMKATIEKSVAVRDSEVIAYAEPTENQRQYTNFSYAGQEGVFNFFIVTGSVEYKAGDALAHTLLLGSDFYLITGGYGDDKDETLSFDSIPAEAMDSREFAQAVEIVESLRIY